MPPKVQGGVFKEQGPLSDPSPLQLLLGCSSSPLQLYLGTEAQPLRGEQDRLFHRRDAEGLWERALCSPGPTVSHADPCAAMAFLVPPLLQLSEEPGHLSGLESVGQTPAWSPLENEGSVLPLCVYWESYVQGTQKKHVRALQSLWEVPLASVKEGTGSIRRG